VWTVHDSARSTRLSVRLSKWALPEMPIIITVAQCVFVGNLKRAECVSMWNIGREMAFDEGTLATPGKYA